MSRVNLYVDGESHFIRSEQAWKESQGSEATLDTIRHSKIVIGNTREFPYLSGAEQPLLDRRCKFFWDSSITGLYPFVVSARPYRAVYFTSCAGDESLLHELCLKVRAAEFEPYIIKERSDLASRRAQQITDLQLLDKPKGVDIAMAVRILEDAYRNLFDECLLFTSDIDYLPVIRAIQQLGKKVAVFGYQQGIGKRSELEHVPDWFIDLNEHLRRHYKPAASG